MKSLLFLIPVFYLTGCNGTTEINQKGSDTIIHKKAYYSTGQLKELISLNRDSVKDGLTTFYDSLGKIDSTENYQNGILNGIKTFYGLDRKIEYYFITGALYSLKVFDTLGNLKYQSPVDPTLVKKPYVKLQSGRSYLPKDALDTIVIITKGIPPYNRVIGFMGATQTKISDSSFSIVSSSKMLRKYKFMTIIISYTNDIEDELAKPVFVDSAFIPIK